MESEAWFAKRGGVVALLAAQIFSLWLSLSLFYGISIFCTGSATRPLSWLFGSLHLLLPALVVLGLVSLAWKRARPVYVLAAMAALALLPVQLWLVDRAILTCDWP